jgi:hypothetical protein
MIKTIKNIRIYTNKLLGSGAFARVYKGDFIVPQRDGTELKKKVAIKEVSNSILT